MRALLFAFVDVQQTHKDKNLKSVNLPTRYDILMVTCLQVWTLVKVGSVRLVADKLFAEIYTQDRGRIDDETSRFTSKLQPTIRQSSSKYNANTERWPHQRT